MSTKFKSGSVDPKDPAMYYLVFLITEAERQGLLEETEEHEIEIYVNGVEVDFRNLVRSMDEHIANELKALHEEVALYKRLHTKIITAINHAEKGEEKEM